MLFSSLPLNEDCIFMDDCMPKLAVCFNCGTRWPEFKYIVTPSIIDFIVFDGGILTGHFFAYTYCQHCDSLEFSPFSALPDEYRAMLDIEPFQEILRQRTQPLTATCYLASAYIMQEIIKCDEGRLSLLLGAAAKYEEHKIDEALPSLLHQIDALANNVELPPELEIAINVILAIKLKQWDRAKEWLGKAGGVKSLLRCYREKVTDLETCLNACEAERDNLLKEKHKNLLDLLYRQTHSTLRLKGYREKVLPEKFRGAWLISAQITRYKAKMPEAAKLMSYVFSVWG